jgi:hypothetical protein
MPNLLGFTLGGFAVFLGFDDEKFKTLIAGEDNEAPGVSSPYKATNFDGEGPLSSVGELLAQFRWVGDMVGYSLFLYGICLAGAAAVAIFRVAFWFDRYQTANRGDD